MQAAMQCWAPRGGSASSVHTNTFNTICRKTNFKETDFEQIVNLGTKLKDIEDCENTIQVGMQTLLLQQSSDAVSKYYAAFPALKKDQQSPLQYFLPPPSWCRKPVEQDHTMQQDVTLSRDWNSRRLEGKRLSTGKERRNSYNGQRKSNTSKKRCHSYSKSFESKENLPEWVTHEGVWDMETQDSVMEFIKAIAFDEGYGTSENTVTDEIRVIAESDMRIKECTVPNYGEDFGIHYEWAIDDVHPRVMTPAEEELYAKFEAKFDRSIEALWSKEQANTPDDECQELPIDFQDLLSSPTDRPPYNPSTDKCSLISLSESIWSNDAFNDFFGANRTATPTESVDVLHDRFKPLNLTDGRCTRDIHTPEEEPFSLYSYNDVYDSVPSVASMMRSLTTLNHSKSRSSFTEVLPRRPTAQVKSSGCPPEPPARPPETDREDLLTSASTHFRPIRKESLDAAAAPPSVVRYADGATFNIQGDLDVVKYRRSESGTIFIDSESEIPERYMEYRTKGIDYGRLNLTEAQREANSELVVVADKSLKFRVCQLEKGIQTEETVEVSVREGPIGSERRAATGRWGTCDECSRLAGAKKMRQSGSGLASIWSESGEEGRCGECASRGEAPPPAPPPPHAARPPLADEWSREWDELLSDISYAHALYAASAEAEAEEGAGCGGGEWWRADRKRRHSATVWCAAGARGARCPHPHDAPFLHCCSVERPLTR